LKEKSPDPFYGSAALIAYREEIHET